MYTNECVVGRSPDFLQRAQVTAFEEKILGVDKPRMKAGIDSPIANGGR